MTVVKFGLVLASAMLFVIACASPATNNSTVTTTTTPALQSTPPANVVVVEPVASGDGKELYATNCMICHKEDGTGGRVTIKGKNLRPENLTADKFKKADDDKLIGYVVDGEPEEGMPSFKGKLDDDQIKAIIAHVRTLQQ